MKKKVLITGGSHAEIPLIEALHRLGYYVISTGMNRDGLGHKTADLYEPQDFSDKVAMLALARKHEVSGIVSGCNDFAYISAAYVAEELGLGGHDKMDQTYLIHHKNRFRQLQKECGVNHPGFFICDGVEDVMEAQKKLNLPVVVKPIDLTGGKGVSICPTWELAEQQFHEAKRVSREAQILIEECIRGANHGVSALIKGGKVVFAFYDNEEYYINKYLVSGAYSPSDLTEENKADINRQIEIIAERAALCDGVFHCQCIITDEGKVYLIDPCRRAPGDLYVKLVSYSTGLDYPMAIVKSELGLPFDQELAFQKANHCIARECIMAERNGVIRRIIIEPEYESHIIDKMQWLEPGDRIENYLTGKAGIVFFEFDNKQELKERMEHLRDNMRIDVS